MCGFWNSLSLTHTGSAWRNEAKPRRREREVGLEQPLELEERLVVERHQSMSAARVPVLSRHERIASCGKPASCFLRVKRSSCAAATTRPSTSSAAALSW